MLYLMIELLCFAVYSFEWTKIILSVATVIRARTRLAIVIVIVILLHRHHLVLLKRSNKPTLMVSRLFLENEKFISDKVVTSLFSWDKTYVTME